MSVPAVAVTTGSNIVLTTADLAARSEAPDIQYAYVANRAELRFGSVPSFGGPGGGGPPPDASADGGPPPDATASAQGQQQSVQQVEGPQPVLDEVRGYEVTPEYFDAWGLRAAKGSLFTTADMQSGAAVIVLGSTLATTLFEDGISLDRQVLSRRTIYRVVGLLEPTGTEIDSMVFMPAMMAELRGFGAAARMSPSFNTSLHFTVAASTRLEQAKAQLESWFQSKYGAGAVVVAIPRDAAQAAADRASRLVTLIVLLALSALLIATANVTNILGSRAMRRRRSVGILKALGASVPMVFRLFFLEAFLIGIGGAALGAGLSVLMSWLMHQTMGFGGLDVGFLILGIFGASALVAAVDVFPALSAARAPAAEAIRYE